MRLLCKKFQHARKHIVNDLRDTNIFSKTCRRIAFQASILILGGVFIAYLYTLSLVFQHSVAHFLVVNFSQFGISTCNQYYSILQFLYLMVILVFSGNKRNFLHCSNYSLKSNSEQLTRKSLRKRATIMAVNCLWFFLDKTKTCFLTISRFVMQITAYLTKPEDKKKLLKSSHAYGFNDVEFSTYLHH